MNLGESWTGWDQGIGKNASAYNAMYVRALTMKPVHGMESGVLFFLLSRSQTTNNRPRAGKASF